MGALKMMKNGALFVGILGHMYLTYSWVHFAVTTYSAMYYGNILLIHFLQRLCLFYDFFMISTSLVWSESQLARTIRKTHCWIRQLSAAITYLYIVYFMHLTRNYPFESIVWIIITFSWINIIQDHKYISSIHIAFSYSIGERWFSYDEKIDIIECIFDILQTIVDMLGCHLLPACALWCACLQLMGTRCVL